MFAVYYILVWFAWQEQHFYTFIMWWTMHHDNRWQGWIPVKKMSVLLAASTFYTDIMTAAPLSDVCSDLDHTMLVSIVPGSCIVIKPFSSNVPIHNRPEYLVELDVLLGARKSWVWIVVSHYAPSEGSALVFLSQIFWVFSHVDQEIRFNGTVK